MPDFSCDVAVIGAGTAGLAAERSARRNGATTLLIDEAFRGTTCATVGCMPSKLLIAAGNAAYAVRHAAIFGVKAHADVDGAAVLQRVRHERDRFVAGVQASLANLPAGIRLTGHASFTGQSTLRLDDGRTVTAKAVVIATGSAPAIPATFDAVRDRILTNETIFDLPALPAAIGVIGVGPLGLELAQALARLGVEVAVFDEGHKLAALGDEAVAKSLGDILRREFPIHLGVKLTAERGDAGVVLTWTGDDAGTRRFDHLLVAAGRPPRLTGIGLEKTGLLLDEHGAPKVDPATRQCGSAPIFIAGDADHDRPVLHEAQAEGTIAGRNAATFPAVKPGRRTVAFSIMFTDPPLAVIGELPGPDKKLVCGSADYADQGRAKVFATNAGIANIYAEPGDGRLAGAAMVGPGADHSAHLLVWAIEKGMTATEVLDLPFYHPTYEEGLKPAFRAICKAVHAPTPVDRDDGFVPGS